MPRPGRAFIVTCCYDDPQAVLVQFLEDLGRCFLGRVSDSDDTGQFAVYGHEHSHFTLGAGHLPPSQTNAALPKFDKEGLMLTFSANCSKVSSGPFAKLSKVHYLHLAAVLEKCVDDHSQPLFQSEHARVTHGRRV